MDGCHNAIHKSKRRVSRDVRENTASNDFNEAPFKAKTKVIPTANKSEVYYLEEPIGNESENT